MGKAENDLIYSPESLKTWEWQHQTSLEPRVRGDLPPRREEGAVGEAEPWLPLSKGSGRWDLFRIYSQWRVGERFLGRGVGGGWERCHRAEGEEML
jgi:hypothetical protein